MVNDIGDGLKSTITTVTVARTFATDPRNIVTLTAVHIAWVWAGMLKKYGEGLPQENKADLQEYQRLWKIAQSLIKDGENWDRALMHCQDIFTNCLTMAVLNDFIDYDIFDNSITDKLFGGEINEKDMVEQKPSQRV